MPRLVWGDPTERFFETGIDRGVLYVGTEAGVPWNGLTSVTEEPSGGEAKPAYIDGRKFRNVILSEEFEATIEAFSAPPEFAPCDGLRSIQNGLIVTNQPRKSFSFTYRTLIGNVPQGTDLGYKIHLVYNALASPSQRNHTTISDAAEAEKFSWSVTTLPPSIYGYRPTAHLIVDSRYTPSGTLSEVEDILYGSVLNTPRMPTPSELVAIFEGT